MKILLYLFLLILFCDCSTLTKEQCHKGDWQKIGFIDGKKGRSADYLEFHKRSCPNSSATLSEYNSGRLLGLIEFCTFQGGYSQGVQGQSFSNVCQGLNEKEFEEAYVKGRNVYLLKQRKTEVISRREEREEKIENDQSVVNHVSQVFNLLGGRSPTEFLDKEERKIDNEIYKIESSLPANVSSNRYSVAQQDLMWNSLGAFTGTFMGFGLGHAIQGRYAKSGWQWTIADVASITSMAVAATNSPCRSTGVESGNLPSNCSDALPLVTALGFIGLRVWQSISLWSYIGKSEYDSNYHVSVNPNGIYILGQF